MKYYDIGVLHGCDTDYALSRNYEVIAVEANPYLYKELSEKYGNNRRVCLIHYALVPEQYERRQVFLHLNKEHPEWSSCVRKWNQETIKVPSIKLSDLFRDCGVPDVLKMDIESMEKIILQSLQTLPQRPPYIICEFSSGELVQLLRDMGYNKFRISNQNKRNWNCGFDFDNHGSGPFGDELNGPWKTQDELMMEFRTLDPKNYWADLHARP
jgi:FkbM family methyltransferase